MNTARLKQIIFGLSLLFFRYDNLWQEIKKSIFITGSTSGSDDMYESHLMAKGAKKFRESFLLILGNPVPKKRI